ncbi:MAG: hypothetical protein LBB13_00915, partial [Rickettsiales bacterium]|nr:hypothetical protein [Rickettsiales bacterium]
MKIRRRMINAYGSDLRRRLNQILNSSGTKVYNMTGKNIQPVDASDIVLINILDLDDYKHINNIKLSRFFLRKYKNISVYYIIINKNSKKNGIYDLFDGEIEMFIKKNNLRGWIMHADVDIVRKYLNLEESNKVIVANRRYDLEGVFDSSTDVRLLEKFLKDSSRTSVIYDRSRVAEEDRGISDEYLINSMSRIIVIENFNGFKFPVFAILDSYSKMIIIAKFNGEIMYLLED